MPTDVKDEVELQEQLKMVISDMQKKKQDIKEVKKDIRKMKKNDDQDYVAIKKKIKELKKDTDQMQLEFEKDLNGDEEYNALLKLKMKSEEEYARLFARAQELITQLPPKPIQLTIEGELGRILANINPEMKLYVNGREEKRS